MNNPKSLTKIHFFPDKYVPALKQGSTIHLDNIEVKSGENVFSDEELQRLQQHPDFIFWLRQGAFLVTNESIGDALAIEHLPEPVPTPTPEPVPTPTPEPVPTPTPEPVPTPTPEPVPTPTPEPVPTLTPEPVPTPEPIPEVEPEPEPMPTPEPTPEATVQPLIINLLRNQGYTITIVPTLTTEGTPDTAPTLTIREIPEPVETTPTPGLYPAQADIEAERVALATARKLGYVETLETAPEEDAEITLTHSREAVLSEAATDKILEEADRAVAEVPINGLTDEILEAAKRPKSGVTTVAPSTTLNAARK
jgi:hypothetical protein